MESRCVRPGRGRDNDDGAPKDHRRIPYHLKTVKSVGEKLGIKPRIHKKSEEENSTSFLITQMHKQ